MVAGAGRPLGAIVRLQVQRNPVKVGQAPLREYRPESLVSVTELRVTERGSHGVLGAESIIDVHHQDHPETRDPRGQAGLTVMATGDYRHLRELYGERLVDGIAGEAILIDHPGLAGMDLSAGLTLRTAGGLIGLDQVRVAKPCVEFTRFCLRQPVSAEVDDSVRDGLCSLDDGHRGYRAVASAPGRIRLGDTLFLGRE